MIGTAAVTTWVHRFLYTVLLAGCLVSQSGCVNYGPKTLNKDQLDYGRSIGDTWKNQLLTNLVKLRFLDMPVFVDVGQIVSGYTVETTVTGSLGFDNSLVGGDSQILAAEGRYTDRPTITYTPKTGQEYLRSLLEPIAPSTLLSLVQADYSAEMLFTWAVESINGLRNFSAREDEAYSADPRFVELVSLLNELQQIGAIRFELEHDPATKHDAVAFFPEMNLDDTTRGKQTRVRRLAGLNDETRLFRVVYSPYVVADDVLAIQTRSVIQMLIAISKFVDVPPGKASRVTLGHLLPAGSPRPFRVYSSPDEPADAFARTRYHGDWYWIDHNDLTSKRVFGLMLFLTTLTNRTSEEGKPVLTIPTN